MDWTLLGLGIGFAAVAGYKAARCSSAASWPTVPGEVVQSHLEEVTEERTTDDNREETRTRHRAWVRYGYQVRGKDYVGDHVSLGFQWHLFEWTARNVADRYPIGTKVRVHYSSRNPAEAVLETGVTWASIGVLVLGLGLIAWGLATK